MLVFAENAEESFPYVSGVLAGIDGFPDAGLLVVANDWSGLLVIGDETLFQGVGVVVCALDQGVAGHVVFHGLFGWVEDFVIGSARRRVDQSSGDSGDE